MWSMSLGNWSLGLDHHVFSATTVCDMHVADEEGEDEEDEEDEENVEKEDQEVMIDEDKK